MVTRLQPISQVAGKITARLLEMDSYELLILAESEVQFKARVEELTSELKQNSMSHDTAAEKVGMDVQGVAPTLVTDTEGAMPMLLVEPYEREKQRRARLALHRSCQEV